MGLCFSINRTYRKLENCGVVDKRTFKNVTRLVRLVDIYDGDTFKVITRLSSKEPTYEYSLRLAGIDAPEMKPLLTDPDRDLHKRAAINVRDILRKRFP